MIQDILKASFGATTDNDTIFRIASYLVPAILSLIELILIFVFFRFDTPLQLMEDELEPEAVTELQKIYVDSERRNYEYDCLKILIRKIKLQYPTYRELFSRNYIPLLLNGILIILARNCCGFFIYRQDIEKRDIENIFAFYGTAAMLAVIASFFIINCICFIKNSSWDTKIIICRKYYDDYWLYCAIDSKNNKQFCSL